MKLVLFAALLLVSCRENTSLDFTDAAIAVALDHRGNTYIELPDLYPDYVASVPTSGDRIELVGRLTAHGFKITSSETGNAPLDGKRYIRQTLKGENCECDVVKTYSATAYVAQYKVSERIRCR